MKLSTYLGLSAAMILSLASWNCSDNDDATPLVKTEITSENATYNSLTFEWEKVKDARQYSYELSYTGTGDIIEVGVTKDTRLTFTGLTHDTDYTLTVLAYAAIGSGNTTSEPIVLTARTADLTTLATPELSWSREANTVILTWNAVAGARDYSYSLTDADGNTISYGSTYDTYASFAAMTTGTFTATVVANTEQEGFRNSHEATVTFDFTRQREELWRASGYYTSALLGKSWTAQLVAYDDNSYTLLGWYGTEGINLEFSIDETNASDMFRLGSEYSYSPSTDSYSVPTGLLNPAQVIVYASGNRCAMEGNAGQGSVVLSVSDGTASGNDTFKWGVTIEDLVGTWTVDFVANDVSDSTYDETYTAEVEITLGSEANTLLVPMPNYFGYLGSTAPMVVDLSTMTFTMQPVSHGGVFTFAGNESDTSPLTGKVSDSTIVFNEIQAWYSGYYYLSSTSSLKYTR